MRSEGWVFLAVSWSVILLLFLFSMVRTLRQKDKRRQQGKNL
jgi:preprotein translocase subunit YajC